VTWLGAPYVTTVPLPATICVPIPDATIIPLPAFGVPVPIPDAGRVRTIQSTYYSDPQLVGVWSDVGSQPMNDAGDGVPAAPPPPATPPPRANFKAAPPIFGYSTLP